MVNIRRVLITGATGYLGSQLVHTLYARGVEISVLTRDPVRAASQGLPIHRLLSTHLGAKALREAVEECRPDVVYHLAASAERQPSGEVLSDMINVNVGLGVRLLDAMSGLPGTRFIHALSYWCFDHAGAPRPNGVYAASKLAFMPLCNALAAAGGLRATGAVLYDIYGPKDPRAKLIPSVIKATLAGQALTLRDPAARFAPVFVGDVVAALELLGADASDTTAEVVAVAPPATATVKTVLELIRSATGIPLSHTFEHGSPVVETFPENGSAFAAPMGWAPQTSLKDGIALCVAGEA